MSSEAQSRTEPQPPFQLPDRYRVRRHVATGGMASVWCAEDLVLGRSVAIKVLAERFAHDWVAVRRFKREARAAARVCAHAHVVTVFDVGELPPEPEAGPSTRGPGPAFIVMEYLAGGTVADAIRHDSVRRHEALRWLREAASALDHAHRHGIVHRDIKPANFLLDRSRVLHVADFGIARLVSEDTITTAGQLFGTAAYLSPEQAMGREATSASDRYALAVAAFELLVGERPFSSPHFAAQARQHIEDQPPRASDRDRTIPPAVDDVLIRGLAKAAADRPATAGELVSDLHDALADTRGIRPHPISKPVAPVPSASIPSVPAAPPTPTVPPSRRTASRRAVALSALAVAAVAVAVIGLAALRSGGSPRPIRQAARTVTATTTRHATPTRAAAKPARHRPRTASTPATTPAPAPTSAVSLQATGHQEMLDGNYQTAIPTLRQAVDAASQSSLTYAYALYDLGRSMVLGGDPSGAIPVLRQRLQIPNQTGVVRQMLAQALAAAGEGQAQPQSTPAPRTGRTSKIKPGTPHGAHPSGSGESGGAGLAPPASRGGGQDRGNGHGNGPLKRHAIEVVTGVTPA